MERFQEARAKALQNLKVADHLLNVTYPLIQDTKLLLAVLDHLFLSLANTMSALLWYKRLLKEVPPFSNNFDGKFNTFTQWAQQHHIDKEYAKMMMEIKELIMLHRKSKVEFRKKDRFIVCDDNYSVTAVTASKLKWYLKKTNDLSMIVNGILDNERIFRGSERRIEAC